MAGKERKKSLEDNPNIGALGRSEYQEANKRVKGFSSKIMNSVEEYESYLAEKMLPVLKEEIPNGATRVIERTIAKTGVFNVGDNLSKVGLQIEAAVTLGGRWEGHSWVMAGVNFPGRKLSENTHNDLIQLARKASAIGYEPVKPLPAGFSLEIVKPNKLSSNDHIALAKIFQSSFKDYISNLTTPENVKAWEEDTSTFPLVARNAEGEIVVVTNGDLGVTTIEGREFKFLEIGDSASNPEYRNFGLNRNLKALLISEGKRLGFDSIHAETRAAYGSPNFGNAKNGMQYFGTLPMNCVISGIQDVPETLDPSLNDFYRKFGSLNVWAMTPANPHWFNY